MHSNKIKFQNLIKFFIYFFPVSFIIGNSAINLNIFLIIIISGIYFFIFKTNLKKNNIIFVIFFLTLYLCLLTLYKILSSPDDFSPNEILRAIGYLRYPIFALLLYNIFYYLNFDLKKTLYIYSLPILLLIFDIPFQYIFGFNIIGIVAQSNQYNSFFFSEKVAGGFILNFLFFLIAGIYLFFKDKKFSELYQTLIIAFSLIAIFLSQNKMPLLLSVFGLIVFSLLHKKILRSVALSILIFISFLFIFSDYKIKNNYAGMIDNIKSFTLKSKLFTMYLNDAPLEKIKKQYPDTHKTEDVLYHATGSGHAQIFSSSLIVIKENNILGTGLKGYHKACRKLDYKLWCDSHPHNYYLDIIITSGLPGILIVTVIIFLIIRKFLNLKIYVKKNFNLNEVFYLILIVNFAIIFFPFKSSGSFFTTGNLTYIIFTLSLISYFQEILKKE